MEVSFSRRKKPKTKINPRGKGGGQGRAEGSIYIFSAFYSSFVLEIFQTQLYHQDEKEKYLFHLVVYFKHQSLDMVGRWTPALIHNLTLHLIIQTD